MTRGRVFKCVRCYERSFVESYAQPFMLCRFMLATSKCDC